MPEECSSCGASFASPSELVEHMKKAHPQPNPKESLAMNPNSRTPGYTCALCGATFRTPQELAAHDLKPHDVAHPADAPQHG
jgi:DNA-directed RNA polymerase subunit RPC12/RpoP